MSAIEVLIAGIGFCSSVVPYISRYVVKKYLKQRKLKIKMTELYLHPFFKFINEYILHSPFRYIGDNIYENIYLSIYYSVIIENIYNIISECISEDVKESDMIDRLKEIIIYDMNYISFNTLMKEKKDIYEKYNDFFININNFEKIKEKVDKIRDITLLNKILDNLDSYIFDKVNDKINFLIIFLKVYQEVIKKEVENLRNEKIKKVDDKLPKYNILFELNDSGNIIYYNKAYCHLIDYLDSKIINKNILDINIIQEEDKMEDFIKFDKKIKSKVKRSVFDNFYDLSIYTKIIENKKYILMEKEFKNIFPKYSPSFSGKRICSPPKSNS